jgi:hypothetical protein
MGSDSGVKEGRKERRVLEFGRHGMGCISMYDLPETPQARLLCITMERKDQDTSLSSSEDK